MCRNHIWRQRRIQLNYVWTLFIPIRKVRGNHHQHWRNKYAFLFLIPTVTLCESHRSASAVEPLVHYTRRFPFAFLAPLFATLGWELGAILGTSEATGATPFAFPVLAPFFAIATVDGTWLGTRLGESEAVLAPMTGDFGLALAGRITAFPVLLPGWAWVCKTITAKVIKTKTKLRMLIWRFTILWPFESILINGWMRVQTTMPSA